MRNKMSRNVIFSTVIACAVFSVSLAAHAEITVKDAWIRATVSQQKVTGAFMQINSSTDTRLVEVQSPAAGIVELHKMTMGKDIMKMRSLDHIDLVAGKALELKPGTLHIMMKDLKKQVKAGDAIPVTLIFEAKDKTRQILEIKVIARALNAG